MPPSGIAAWGKRTRPRIEHRVRARPFITVL
jgi:hypothetical protein